MICFSRKEAIRMNTYVTGTTIKQLRESRKLTQAELGESIGVSSKTISKWERAESVPDVSVLLRTEDGQDRGIIVNFDPTVD